MTYVSDLASIFVAVATFAVALVSGISLWYQRKKDRIDAERSLLKEKLIEYYLPLLSELEKSSEQKFDSRTAMRLMRNFFFLADKETGTAVARFFDAFNNIDPNNLSRFREEIKSAYSLLYDAVNQDYVSIAKRYRSLIIGSTESIQIPTFKIEQISKN